MSEYSCEEREFIEQFVATHSLNEFSAENEEKWHELGTLMNRDWEHIRKTYDSWKIQEDQPGSAIDLEIDDHTDYQILDLDDLVRINQLLSSNETNSADGIKLVNVDSRLLSFDQLEDIVGVRPKPHEPLPSQIEYTSENVAQSSSAKRPQDVLGAGINTDEIAAIFEKQSLRELELKKEEHLKKMMIYKQQLLHGEEQHKEKMKILKAKLKAIEENIGVIDSTICHKNLRQKKFKSGSI